jgi:ligand-binding SRPBCC domain-containing protein
VGVFVKSVWIAAPLADVFRFHERQDALVLLSPAFPPVRVFRRVGGIAKGARVELRVGVFRWVAVHTAYEQDAFFVDEQIEGPFAAWVHRHEFAGEGGKTRLTDRVEYRLKGGWLVNWLFGWLVNLGLRWMFTHRHEVTIRICEEGG